jgi:hypothetical protein
MSNKEATLLFLCLAFIATIIWGFFQIFHFGVAEQPWVRIFLFMAFGIGLGYCIYGLVKLRQNKLVVSNVFWPTIGLIIGIIICLGFVINEIMYFITNVL